MVMKIPHIFEHQLVLGKFSFEIALAFREGKKLVGIISDAASVGIIASFSAETRICGERQGNRGGGVRGR